MGEADTMLESGDYWELRWQRIGRISSVIRHPLWNAAADYTFRLRSSSCGEQVG
jgi:hypothetical protein